MKNVKVREEQTVSIAAVCIILRVACVAERVRTTVRNAAERENAVCAAEAVSVNYHRQQAFQI